jgi:hypothetical protein
MKNNFKLISILLFSSFLWVLQGCEKSDKLVTGTNPIVKSPSIKTYLGPSVKIGNGTGQAWVAVDSTGSPNAVGINLSENALDSLPKTETGYTLRLPNVGKNFYTHMTVDWNPQGHPPVAIYGIPHFDFHFYIIPEAERLAIGNDSTKFAKGPGAKYLPDHYIFAGGVPQMGAHWADITSAEFTGSPFTKTFIWGTYNGDVIFWEPMVSRAYLLTHPDDLVNLPQPQAFQKDGWYASSYQVLYSADTKQYIVALTNLVFHKGQ